MKSEEQRLSRTHTHTHARTAEGEVNRHGAEGEGELGGGQAVVDAEGQGLHARHGEEGLLEAVLVRHAVVSCRGGAKGAFDLD